MDSKKEPIVVDRLPLSAEVVALDFDDRRDDLTQHIRRAGEVAMFAEPMESLLWYVEVDPLLVGAEGAKRILDAHRQLAPFFEDFAHEQATGTGPTPTELSVRLQAHIDREFSAA